MTWHNLQADLAEMFGHFGSEPKDVGGYRTLVTPASRRAARDIARGDRPKQSWKLTPEQKAWAVSCGLSARETGRALGVCHKAVLKFRKRGQDVQY